MKKKFCQKKCILLFLKKNLHTYWMTYINKFLLFIEGSVGWGCGIHPLHLCRGVRPPTPNECLGYDTKQSDGKVPVMLELCGTQSILSLPSLPGPFCLRVVAPDRVLSLDQIELNCVLTLNWIVWNRTVLILNLCTYAKLNCLK